MQTIDIVCPVYQEEETIQLFHTQLSCVVNKLSPQYACRIIYVLDPSPDRTESILAGISGLDPRVELLVMSRRFGHQLALIAGIDHCRGDAIIMLDSDLQHPPELITRLVEIWNNGADVVQCIRQDALDGNAIRRLMSRWFYKAFLKLGDVELPMGAADYRLLSGRVADVFRARIRERRPFLRALVSWVGFKIAYVPFMPSRRERGKSKYTASSLMNFAFTGICSFSKVPLRICIAVGLIMAAISVLGAFLQLITYYFSAIEVPGWASLFAAVTLIGGIQLFFLGVVGEYITLIFDEVKQRPRYILDRHYRNGQLALVQSFAADYQAHEARENSEKRSYEQAHHSG
jgi:glycosyltransferase involved in cell wall biosynthesis